MGGAVRSRVTNEAKRRGKRGSCVCMSVCMCLCFPH